MIALYLKENGNNDRQFSIRNFSDIDYKEWEKVVQRLRSDGFIKRERKSCENGDKVTIYKDAGLLLSFERWNKKYDWREFLY
jgi:hypothetical protein